MTVLNAYQLLESQGLIRSVDRSGYKVSAPTKPTSTSKVQHNESVSVNDFIYDVLQASRDPHMFSLGFAYPDPSLYPKHHLSKALARTARDLSSASAFDNLPPGNLALRKLIAKRYAAKGVLISPDEIVITAGALEALNLSLQVCTSPGDSVIIESPTFYGAMQALERLGLKAVTVETSPTEGVDLTALERALQTERIKACWLMSHCQNPMGYSLNDEKKQRIAQLLEKYAVPLIEDDVYAELYEGQQSSLPIKHYLNNSNGLLCSSFSKSLIAGYRIGWVAAGKHAEALQKQQLMSTLATSAPIQHALVDYLSTKNYEQHLKSLRKTLKKRKASMRAFLSEHMDKQVTIDANQGGYFLWLTLPRHIDTMPIYQQALRFNLSLAPGKLFCLQGEFSHCIRLNASFELTPARQNKLVKLVALITNAIKRENSA